MSMRVCIFQDNKAVFAFSVFDHSVQTMKHELNKALGVSQIWTK